MKPITLIPWQNDFIPTLGELLVAHEDFNDITVLFPHNRPRRYLKRFFANNQDLPRPCFLPQITSIAEFVSDLRRQLTDEPIIQAHQLDLVEMLRSVVADLRSEGRGLLARLPELDREAFLPWGIRLAKLMDDILRQNIDPDDLQHMDGEVSNYAAALLEQLGAIHHAYVSRLFERGLTTSGLDWRFVTKNISKVTDHLNNKTIIAAGFYALSGAEDLLFRRLWEEGILHPVIHSDAALANGKKPHWSTKEHSAWLTRWRIKAEIPNEIKIKTIEPNIRFCEGYDRHSQLAALATDLNSDKKLNETAIVLPEEGALLPVLHHIPDKEPNISMGYPLDRTSLARLIETLLSLQENKLEDGRYYWRDVVSLIRHPYLRLLGPDEKPLRKVFYLWESTIRTGDRYINPLAWDPPYEDGVLKDVKRKSTEPLRMEILKCCLTSLESANTLEKVGDGLSELAKILHKHGEKLWHTYLIDAECLFRLTSSVIPQLKSADASTEQFSKTTLYSMLRRILSQERVSFEAEPLAGLQILGVLETRLLHFKRLFILDAVEEMLPGTNPFDPLLPDPLRRLLGLPDARERDNVSSYNFYRLLMGAKEVVIYYQSGIQPGLLDSKSVRSRFVEQLLWEREKQDKQLIETGGSLIQAVTFPTSAMPTDIKSIPMTDAINKALRNKLEEKGLSASRLDQYMNCPKQFFYNYLTRIRPISQVNEDGDRSEFGSLIHEVLREFMTPYIGKKTDLSKLEAAPLLTLFNDVFKASDFFARLPSDTRMALIETTRYRLKKLLASQGTTTLIGLEKKLDTTIELDGLTIPLTGTLDRVERQDKGIVILDYKTGNGTVPKQSFWQNMELQERMEACGLDDTDSLLLTDLTKSVQSVQLPIYLHLFAKCENEKPHDAGLIMLADDGKIKNSFGKKWTDEERIEAIDEIAPRLINTLVHHMLSTSHFTAQPGTRCQWCDFKKPCGQ